MKDNNLPDDNNSKSLEELTQEVNSIIEELEKQEDIKNSLDDYQKLINCINVIQKGCCINGEIQVPVSV